MRFEYSAERFCPAANKTVTIKTQMIAEAGGGCQIDTEKADATCSDSENCAGFKNCLLNEDE